MLEAIRLGTPVLYDGTQPAAALMDGRGSRYIDAQSRDSLARAFVDWSEPAALDGLTAELDPASVPTWRAFAAGIAEAVTTL